MELWRLAFSGHGEASLQAPRTYPPAGRSDDNAMLAVRLGSARADEPRHPWDVFFPELVTLFAPVDK